MIGPLACTGCVERRINITSEPPGAIVWLNDVEVGRTPVSTGFTFYGTYDVRLNLEGYEPLVTSAEAHAPVYEYPVVDLLAIAWPGRIVSKVNWHFDLEPAQTDQAALLERAAGLRTQLGESEPPEPAPTDDRKPD